MYCTERTHAHSHACGGLCSRAHILQQFNAGLFDFLVATDDVHPSGGKGRGGKRDRQRDVEFGVVRGVDFKEVRGP